MSALRQRLKRPETYLVAVAILFAIAAYDANRAPESQAAARCYVRLVEAYQRHGRSLSTMVFQCRYRPTCSEYSRQVVSKYGLARGLQLTFHRLASCRSEVAMGTLDPVP